jgi:predicted esterase
MKNLLLRVLVTFTGIYLFSGISILKAQTFPTGAISDSVKCSANTGQKYALYLPALYSEKKQWPVILIFDPGGQGVTAVKAFRKAAEKYGYILACSYNSRNGPLNINFEAAQFMLNDLEKRFKTDNGRIYAAGFSGGSRFALALASTGNIIKGVIGCGAGLPNDQNLLPSIGSSFVYYGIAGNRDMNYLEMFDLMTFFNNKTQVIPYLRTFDGGHQWPTSEILQGAIEWINIQTINKKSISPDTTFISYYSKQIRTLIDNSESEGNKVDEARYMQFAVRDFSGQKFAREISSRLSMLEQTKEFRAASREWNDIAISERKMTEKYVSSIREIINSQVVSDSTAAWWKTETGSLKSMKERAKPANSQMASRLMNFISVLCSEQATGYYRQKSYNLSSFLFEICTMSDSENLNNYYNLSRSLSASNYKRRAIDYLNRAIDHGLISKKTVENEPAFNNIRNEEKYKLLLSRLK